MATAYLLLIIDIRPNVLSVERSERFPRARKPLNAHRMTVDIFSESKPTLPFYCRAYLVQKEDGDEFGACRDALLDKINDPSPSNYLAWLKPLLSARLKMAPKSIAAQVRDFDDQFPAPDSTRGLLHAIDIEDEIAHLTAVLRNRGVDVDLMLKNHREAGSHNSDVLKDLVGSLYDGLAWGNWPYKHPDTKA